MTTIRDVESFLALRRIAMVGVSRNPDDFSRKLLRELCERGYDMVPVNLVAVEIDGRECFQCLQAVKPLVEGVLVMTPSYETIRVVRDCAEANVRQLWMYRAGGKGAVSAEAIAFCRENRIQVVEGHCPFMFLPATAFPHRAHGFFLGWCGGIRVERHERLRIGSAKFLTHGGTFPRGFWRWNFAEYRLGRVRATGSRFSTCFHKESRTSTVSAQRGADFRLKRWRAKRRVLTSEARCPARPARALRQSRRFLVILEGELPGGFLQNAFRRETGCPGVAASSQSPPHTAGLAAGHRSAAD